MSDRIAACSKTLAGLTKRAKSRDLHLCLSARNGQLVAFYVEQERGAAPVCKAQIVRGDVSAAAARLDRSWP